VCFEHDGYARQKAASWWANRAPGKGLPKRVDEALALTQGLKCPSQIAVKPNGRFVQIVGARF
jgi:DNA repair protein RadD